MLAFLQTLGGVSEKPDDPLDGLLHAEKIMEGRITLDCAVEEDAAEPQVLAGIHQLRLADGRNHPLGGTRMHQRIVAAAQEIVLKRHLLLQVPAVDFREEVENVHSTAPLSGFERAPPLSPRFFLIIQMGIESRCHKSN